MSAPKPIAIIGFAVVGMLLATVVISLLVLALPGGYP